MTADRLYFARAPKDQIAHEIMDKWNAYQEWLSRSGYGYMIQSLYDQFYNFDKSGGFRITKREGGAISDIEVNHFKNLLQRLSSLVTQSKLAFVPRARNTDSDSQVQADFAKGLLEFYNDEKAMNRVTSEAVERALVMLEAFVYCPWDESVGEPVAAENGRKILQGDQAYSVLSAFDVARNTKLKKSPWHIVRERVNRYDLAAQHPEFESEILNASDVSDQPYHKLVTPFDSWQQTDEDEETVYRYTFLHDRTAAMPGGRVTQVVGNTVLSDSALYYKRVPLARLSAGDCYETIAGDSPATSLLNLQMGINALTSAVTTNNLNGAMQNIYSRDKNIDIQQISKGQNLILAAEKPEAVSLVNSAAETYKLLDNFVDAQQLLSGVNATTRGTPEASLKSGNSLALMLAQSIQFVNKLQENYAQAVGEIATITIENLQAFCSEPKLAYIGGVSKKSRVQKFTSKDIDAIDRVSVDLGNPITSSISGRYELLQQFVQYGTDQKVMRQMATFLKTGEIDSALEDEFSGALLVKEENEKIRKGVVPQVLMLDNPLEHLKEHATLSNDLEVRGNPALMQALLAHQQAHIDQWRNMPPHMLMLLNIPPFPEPAAPMAAPGEQPPPPQGPAAGPQPGQLPQVNGTTLPNTPPGTPESVTENYQQAVAGLQNLPQPE